ncbi:hypothetical protein BEWA_002250 [Theileria equi strain WA]|uniref:Uncharacterized protein n=1 Tax=Theileria equi strain WA TaxID=1537102 RepID=L0AZY4_THEEQ|nr:hypothetical protein BEWA_002250 [Theileria equi strain WA]AFZ80818.1 hypothetical protein BEWA_002250 [Theileria equi strain WA]|eukprot:XP_004830484.1 hypothetical protein BEWA_002250 [Theileria equi strain WA]
MHATKNIDTIHVNIQAKFVENNNDHRLVSLRLNREGKPARHIVAKNKDGNPRFIIYKLLAALEENTNLYISDLHINANLPWWRWKTREKDEYNTCQTILKELHSFAMANKKRWIDTSDSGDYYDLAFLFILIIHFKNALHKNFNVLNFTWGWRKRWSNDLLNTSECIYDFPVKLHTKVSSEPIFWQYIASQLFRCCNSIRNFVEYFSGYTDCIMGEREDIKKRCRDCTHLNDSKTGILPDNRKIDKSMKQDTVMLILITESFLPKLLELGLYSTLLKAIQFLLGINIFGFSSIDHICTLGGYMELTTLRGSDSAVVKISKLISQHVGTFFNPKSLYGTVNTSIADFSIIENKNLFTYIDHVFSWEALAELILRILDILGSSSLDRLKSSSRWYNFVRALPNGANLHGCILLLLSNLIIYNPDSLVYHKLLIQELAKEDLILRKKNVKGLSESRLTILKEVVRMHHDQAAIWTAFLSYDRDLDAISNAIKIFPHCLPLYGLYIYRGVLQEKNVDAQFDTLRTQFKLDIDNVKWDCFSINNTHAISRVTAVCIAWVYKHKDRSISNAPFIHLLSEFDLKYIVNMLVSIHKGKSVLKHLECLLYHYPNSNTTCIAYTRVVLERSTRDRLKRTLGTDLLQAQRPRVSRQLERFISICTREGYHNDENIFDELKRNNFDDFEMCSIRLGILSRLGFDYKVLKPLVSSRIPFGISTKELRKCVESE